MTTCPKCEGPVRPIGKEFFCLDCDFDTLTPSRHQGVAETSPDPPQRQHGNRLTPLFIAIDAEWYMKTQLRRHRKWRDEDFTSVPVDYTGKGRYATNYFHASTVEKHEKTAFFRNTPRRQLPVPEGEKINELSYDLTIRGDDLMKAGWTAEMIDRLPTFRPHRWRRKRKFLVCELSKVSPTFHVGPQVLKTPPLGGPSPNPYRFL